MLTAPHHGGIRSAFAGQGNAILVAPGLRISASAELPLNDRARGREPRVAQRAELVLASGRRVVVANLHCSHDAPGEAELARALRWAGDAARPDDVLVVRAT